MRKSLTKPSMSSAYLKASLGCRFHQAKWWTGSLALWLLPRSSFVGGFHDFYMISRDKTYCLNAGRLQHMHGGSMAKTILSAAETRLCLAEDDGQKHSASAHCLPDSNDTST